MNEKKWKNIWRILQKTLIFAPLLERSTKSLDYGVMAAQQVLVLFVLVRIQVVQRKSQSFKVKPRKNVVFAGVAFFRKLRAMKNGIDFKLGDLTKAVKRGHTLMLPLFRHPETHIASYTF